MRFAYFRMPLGWTELVRRTVADTMADGVPGLAAQLAFYYFLALFPALLLVVSLLALLPLETQLASALSRVSAFAPEEVLALISQHIARLREGPPAGLLTLAIAGAVWGSSSAMTAIISTLNQAYDIEERRPFWKMRLVAILLTLVLAILIVVAFTLVVGGSELGAWVAGRLGAGVYFETAWRAVQWPVALFLVVVSVNLVYHIAPNAKADWTWVTPGAVLATALWLAASLGFKLYVQYFSDYGAVYGSIGGVTVLLMWLYLSAFALLVGAELNAEINKAREAIEGEQREGGQKVIGAAADRELQAG